MRLKDEGEALTIARVRMVAEGGGISGGTAARAGRHGAREFRDEKEESERG